MSMQMQCVSVDKKKKKTSIESNFSFFSHCISPHFSLNPHTKKEPMETRENRFFEKNFYSSHQKPIRKIAHAMAMTFSPSRPPRIIISSHLVSIASKSGTKDIRGAREKRGNRSEEEGCLAETAGLSLGFEQAEDVVDLDCCGNTG